MAQDEFATVWAQLNEHERAALIVAAKRAAARQRGDRIVHWYDIRRDGTVIRERVLTVSPGSRAENWVEPVSGEPGTVVLTGETGTVTALRYTDGKYWKGEWTRPRHRLVVRNGKLKRSR